MEESKEIMQQLAEIKALTLLAAKEMLTIDDAVLYTGLGKSYLYVLTCKNKIHITNQMVRTSISRSLS